MITYKELKTKEDFISLKKGDILACEFYRDIHDYPKKYRFNVFSVVQNKESHNEIILQKKNNIYFNWEMFLEGTSNLKIAVLINSKDES